MTPASIVVDGPFCVFQSVQPGQQCFRNYSGRSAGAQTLRWGVEQSRNLMTVRSASQTGKTGRASRRARGCTYVEIPVVAVPCKKDIEIDFTPNAQDAIYFR